MILKLIEWLIGWSPCDHEWEEFAQVWGGPEARMPWGTKFRCVKCYKSKIV